MAADTQPLIPHSKRRWSGASTFAISVLVIIGFFAYSFAVSFWPLANSMDKAQMGMILGVLTAAFSGVVGYYVGSSLGSTVKTEALTKK